jgi:hypothetical protein
MLRLACFSFLLSAVLLAGTGCDPADPSSPNSPDSGGVSFALRGPTGNSVPASADSAFIRVWRPGGANLVRLVDIPDPGQTTSVELNVAPNAGYRAGVLAVAKLSPFNNRKTIQAFGASLPFDVQANDTSRVSLDVQPADITVEVPRQLRPGATDTIAATFQLNIPEVDHLLRAQEASDSTFRFFEGTDLEKLGSTTTDGSVTQRFSISAPSTQDEDTTYVKVSVFHSNIGSDNWLTAGTEVDRNYAPSLDEASFAVPIGTGGGGTIIISFSSDGTVLRRTVR